MQNVTTFTLKSLDESVEATCIELFHSIRSVRYLLGSYSNIFPGVEIKYWINRRLFIGQILASKVDAS